MTIFIIEGVTLSHPTAIVFERGKPFPPTAAGLSGYRGFAVHLRRDPLIRPLSGNVTSNDINQYTQAAFISRYTRASEQRLRTKMARHLCFTRVEISVVKEDAAHESASACEKWYQGSANPSA